MSGMNVCGVSEPPLSLIHSILYSVYSAGLYSLRYIENAAKEKDDGFFIDKDGYAVPSEPITIRKPKKNKKKAINEFTINDLTEQHKFDNYNQ